MFDIGRVCIKTAGRHSDSICAVVDIIDNNFVLIDGNLKRKKCNIVHLEPLPYKIEIKKGADTKEVLSAMQKAGLEIKQKRAKTLKEGKINGETKKQKRK